MSDAPEPHPLSVADAVGAIDRATAFTEPLRRRAEGVTIALWGLISACILLSNGIVDDVHGFFDAGGWRRMVSAFLWVPWTMLGVVATVAVWRIAEVSARRLDEGRRRSPVVILAWFAFLVVLVLIIAFTSLGGAGVGIAAVGIIWLLVGLLDIYKATPTGRRTIIAVGTLIFVAGVTYGWATGGDHDLGWHYLELAGVFTMGLFPVVGGLWQALRG